MLAARHVEPEILDILPAGCPDAVRSRRDLRLINRVMGHPKLLADLLLRLVPEPPRRMLEIGAGDGATSFAVAARLAGLWPGVRITLLDRQALVGAGRLDDFARLGWRAEAIVGDAAGYLAAQPPRSVDVIVANLFLHHFGDDLSSLLAHVARAAPTFAAVEPRRGPFALAASRFVVLLGANRVTRNDAVASVRAGFRENELSALWPMRAGDRLEEGARGLFSHGFGVSGAAERSG